MRRLLSEVTRYDNVLLIMILIVEIIDLLHHW